MQEFYTQWDHVVKKVKHFDLSFSDESLQTNFNKLLSHEIPNMNQFIHVCQLATRYFRQFDNIVDVEIQPEDKLVLLGDLHGCFETLIRLFVGDYKNVIDGKVIVSKVQKVGFPSKKDNAQIQIDLCDIGIDVCGEYNSELKQTDKNYFYFNKAFEMAPQELTLGKLVPKIYRLNANVNNYQNNAKQTQQSDQFPKNITKNRYYAQNKVNSDYKDVFVQWLESDRQFESEDELDQQVGYELNIKEIQTDTIRCLLEPFQQLGQPIQKEINCQNFQFKKIIQPIDEDLLSKLKANNVLKLEKSPNRQLFLFNGDFVDRGGSSYQTLFYLLYMCLCGRHVYLNRGNHESDDQALSMSKVGPMVYEIMLKFPDCDLAVIKPILSDLFASIPICTKFQKRNGDENMNTNPILLTTHAGVPEYIYDLKDLMCENRFRQKNFQWDPTKRENYWHSFVWQYKRDSSTAEFMNRNDIAVLNIGHTPRKTFNRTQFKQNLNGYEPDWSGNKSEGNDKVVIETFSSPTNFGRMHAVVIQGQNINDDLKWEYVEIGNRDFQLGPSQYVKDNKVKEE
ncbi:Serine/threonine-protein_phosphatase [Hexamita inflata]|uniref:Serine/threonine-protein phosphatase n=1 Tax=Hexamita inflata TaxID=28002 RepID=A0AA86P956_9EUKA|nr:Serine/threonine-protein phosphatase [Hexamita inflata]CAI9937925.1 Serine/threonine-protein phosphatase [Hexamita inflata]